MANVSLRIVLRAMPLITAMLIPSFAWGQFFAELSYQLWRGDCPRQLEPAKTLQSSSTEGGVCLTCQFSGDKNKSSLQRLKTSVGEAAENAYLAGLADLRQRQLACVQTQISNLQRNPAELQQFSKDFVAKLTLLGLESRRMNELKKAIPSDKNALTEYEKSILRAEALLQSLPFSEIAPIRQLINHVVLQYQTYTPDRLETWLPNQAKELLPKALKAALEAVNTNRAVMQAGVGTLGVSLDTEARESLAQDSELIEAFRNKNLSAQNELKPIFCRIDAKYGQGAEYRDRTLMAISVLGSGAALGLRKVGISALNSVLTGGSTIGAISIRTAGLLRLLAAAGGTTASLSQIHKACYGQEVSLSAKAANNKNAPTCEENILVSQAEENCLLVSFLNTLGLYATSKAVKDALAEIKTGKAEAAALLKASQGLMAEKESVIFDSAKFKRNPQLEIWRLAEGGAPQQAAKLTHETEESLRISKVVSVKKLTDSASKPMLVTLENGQKGVWKKMEDKFSNGKAEIAAYQVDQKLGFNHVPITVERELDGVKGTLQLFVPETDMGALKDYPSYLKWFDLLIGNLDRHGDNYATVSGRPIAFDHSIAFDASIRGKKPPDFFAELRKFIAPLERQSDNAQVLEAELAKAHASLAVILPERAVYQKLKTTSDREWVATLKDQLSADQIANFLRRRDEIVAGIERAEKIFGEDVLREGQVSPIVRQGALLRALEGSNGAADPNALLLRLLGDPAQKIKDRENLEKVRKAREELRKLIDK